MTDNRTTELLPCPFCGGEAETLTAESMYGGYLFGIMCNDCRSRGDVYTTEAEAIAAWNSRADYHGYEQAAIEAWESIKAWNTRAANDTLTAEQVRKAIMDCSRRGGVTCDGGWYIEGEPQHWQRMADRLNALVSDNEYEAKMDALLCRLTNGKWSKSRAYSLDFMVSCVDEEYETLHAKELVELGSGTCEVECFDDGVDEGMDGEWFSYAPPTWYLSCGHTAQGTEKPNFCHVCGKVVTR